jgi:asparaginyl-tRNA synthetase
VRHAVSFAVHSFFNQNQFFYINTPVITGADAEGAGEMFGVTNFDLNNIPRMKKEKLILLRISSEEKQT